jgi:hypothetical protein
MRTLAADQNILFLYIVSIHTCVQSSNGVEKIFTMDLDGYAAISSTDLDNTFERFESTT